MKRVLCCLVLAACECDPQLRGTAGALIGPPEAVDLDPAPDVVRVRLEARALESPGVFRYAYDRSNPGPTLRAKKGDLLEVELHNALPFDTTLHWHGVHVPWAMDGVSWMQAPVRAGATFSYRFRLESAGTFWYHPHLDTEQQVDGGLYGVLLVEDPQQPRADQEWVLVFDTAAEAGTHSPAQGHARREEHWLVNGAARPVLEARGGSTVRVRLLNAANASYLALRAPGLRVIGGDQGLLAALSQPQRLLLAPGDRAELELLIGEEDLRFEAEPYSLNGGDSLGEVMPLFDVQVTAPRPAAAGLAWPFAGGAVTPDPGYADIVYVLTGSDRLETGLINGERFPNITVHELAYGTDAILEVRNLSSSEHPFHLHGVPFEVLSLNGRAPEMRTLEDTFNLRIRDRLRVQVHADNPGDWMAHCHILPHAEHGMMTVLRILPGP